MYLLGLFYTVTYFDMFKQVNYLFLYSYIDILNYELYMVGGVVDTTYPEAIIRNISYAVYHPKFNFLTGVNDLALLKASISEKIIILLILTNILLKI